MKMGGGETGLGVMVLSPPVPPVRESMASNPFGCLCWNGRGVERSMLGGIPAGLSLCVLAFCKDQHEEMCEMELCAQMTDNSAVHELLMSVHLVMVVDNVPADSLSHWPASVIGSAIIISYGTSGMSCSAYRNIRSRSCILLLFFIVRVLHDLNLIMFIIFYLRCLRAIRCDG